MESNKPVNKINSNESWTSGFWDGALYGATGGAAVMGTLHGGVAMYGSDKRASRLADKGAKISKEIEGLDTSSEGAAAKRAKLDNKMNRVERAVGRQVSFNEKRPSGVKAGALAYGGSVLLGGVAGGLIDNYN